MPLTLDLIFRHGTLVSDGVVIRADLGVKDGCVAAVGRLDDVSAANEVDASGKLLFPGAVDLGISTLAENEFEPASPQPPAALFQDAVAGGATTILLGLDPAASGPFGDQVARRAEDEKAHARVDFGYHYFVVDLPPDRVAHLEEALGKGDAPSVWIGRRGLDARLPAPMLGREVLRLAGAGAVVFMPLSDPLLEQHLRAEYRAHGAMPIGDGGALFPDWAEAEAVDYAGRLAGMTRARVVLRGISSLAGVRALLQLREENSPLVGMVHLAHLIYSATPGSQEEDEDVSLPLAWPAIRTRSDQNALWNAVESGVIQLIGSGHHPLSPSAVAEGIRDAATGPAGVGALSELMPLLHGEGVAKFRLSAETLSMAACADPAKLAGLYPRKGCLQPGSDADIVMIDPGQTHGVGLGNGGVVNSFAGLSTMGSVEAVYLRGEAVTGSSTPRGRLVLRRVSLV